jgi:hypothetical protein
MRSSLALASVRRIVLTMSLQQRLVKNRRTPDQARPIFLTAATMMREVPMEVK